MKSRAEIRKIAENAIDTELEAIKGLRKRLTEDFAKSVEMIYHSEGRVVITGIGKSANIAVKIVSTLNSTGTPAIFMHAADAIHGDLGIIQKDDVVICVSKSGETPEIKVLIPMLNARGNMLIGMVGALESYLAQQADVVLDTTVPKEACPNNLAPTSSTTAQLVMGDALAIALMECRGFNQQDFAKYHPGGALGKKLYLRVSDLYIHNEKPVVDIDADYQTVILEISSKRLGATAVLDNGKLAGIITDGDLRRMMHQNPDLSKVKAKEIMSPNPLIVRHSDMVVDALNIMRLNNITQLLVFNKGSYAGIIHLHDILKEGIL
ncbi:MAG: KpsF/GutQ family sugar-phosphate isomerase [Bacteroidales bacterium]|nr:KpsF/GutQ family sugar-phosphate isomerase [Bacteroidales bacterium]MCF8351104.1 KpsF/GutQ family sugar-phosphate isomerase [Bacteroidales bacterium]MCF8376955.1 KpsF/GutQ family sugar-phosphate isomerase [Bacteroidales bacterium]MCF8401297.1 KpsF/GutQ family sugar-phosphate isomerase [Bacteroidales bacterium]